MKTVNLDRRFYVGSSSIAQGDTFSYLHETMEQAIASAEQKCRDDQSPQIVVEIVAVLRPIERPVEVNVLRLPLAAKRVRRKVNKSRRKRA